MLSFPDSRCAWGLTRAMARRVGLNLSQAVVEGWLSRRELATLVERCDSCACQSPCTSWLTSGGDIEDIPGHCPNKSGLEALAPQ